MKFKMILVVCEGTRLWYHRDKNLELLSTWYIPGKIHTYIIKYLFTIRNKIASFTVFAPNPKSETCCCDLECNKH